MRRTGLGLLAACVALCAGGHQPAAGHGLVLEVVTAQGLVWRTAVRPGERFDLSFVHSSERCRWTHHYRATASGIWQEGSTAPCLGAGMWDGSSDGLAVIRAERGYVVSAPRLIGELSMLGSRRADIALALGARSVALSPMLRDFEPFTVRIR